MNFFRWLKEQVISAEFDAQMLEHDKAEVDSQFSRIQREADLRAELMAIRAELMGDETAGVLQ